jgi:peptide/nickel transport system substrate-binding protein/oligopeptide transport system substrate-binding protein
VPEKAVEYGLRLARASLDAFSAEDAVRAARTALDFLDEEWSGDRAVEGDARTLLARAHRMGGELDAALQEAEAAVRLFQERGQPVRSVSALLVAADTAWQTRRSEDARRWAEQGLEAARAGKDTESLRQLLFLAATLANLRGDHAKANEYLAEASRLAPESNEAIVSETIVAGGRLVAGLANAVRTIEPAAIEINEEWEIAANVYEPLLATDPGGNLVPRLCESWEAVEGGRAFRLALRRDVRFSDGSGLTAQDVKASIEAAARRAGSEPSAYVAIRGWTDCRAGRTEAIEGIVVLGDAALEIRLLEPLPIYPAMLTAVTTAVVRPDPAQQGRSLGTGPFRLATHEPERVVLERNQQYWKGTPPLLDAVEFRSGLSAVALARGFRSGEIDVARDLAPQDLEEILRDPHLRQRLVEAPSKNTYFVTFNSCSGAAVREEPVRRALAGVVRTSELVWRALGRFAQPAVCLIPPGMLGHDPGRRRPSLGFEEAKSCLQEAGIELPLRLKASVHPLFRDRYGSLLNALLGVWSELGAEVEIETPDMTAFLQSFDSANGLDVLIGRWNIDYDDPDDFSYALFHSRAGVWRNWFSSAETDRILEEARSDGRTSVREALYRRFEGVLHEAAAIVPLFHDIDYRLLSPRLRGLSLRSTFPTVNYSELGLVQPGAPDLEARRGQGGTLHVPMASASINTLDPPLGITVEYVDVLPCIYDTLTRETGAGVAPWLAAEMKVEEDGRRYRFRLRDDVRFHDGRRLGARDVRYSFERLLQSSSDNRWLFSSIRGAPAVLGGQARELDGFRIHSATEFTIDVTEPVAFFPALLAFESASIVPEGADPSADLEACVGTGPFRVVAFEPDRRLELERNRNHWRRGYPRCERLVFSFGVAPSDILAGFRAGRFSLATDLFPADAEALRREPGFASRYREAPRLTTYFLALNRHREPLRDRAVRQRLLQAVDVPKLVRQTLGRLALPASGLIPPGLLGHDAAVAARVDASGSVAQRPLSAVVELTAVLHPVFFAGYSAFAKELTTGLAQAGVKVQPLNQNIAGYLDLTANAAVDIVIGRWNADYPDPDTFAAILYSQGGFMGGYCSSPELDRLVERGRAETQPALRREIYRQLEETIAREALLLPLFHEQGYRFARPEIEGLALSSTRGNVLYEELQARA